MSTTIVDVRSPLEYDNGHVQGSINIPLHEIPGRVNEIKTMPQPVILCCASGNRSGQATLFLTGQGIRCENGGSWIDVEYKYQIK
jgi:rhodanese-related sulfurtransferase